MSSESQINPEVSPTVDHGRTLSSDERLSAANREVVGSFDASELDALEGTEAPLQADESEDIILVDHPAEAEVEADDIDPEIEAEDPVDVQDTESVEAEEAGSEDATPVDDVPPALRAEYDDKMARIEKGLQKRLGQLADKEKQLETLILQNRQMMDNNQQVKTEANKPQRPTPPGEGATTADWQTYEDAVVDYRIATKGIAGGLDPEAQQRLAVLEQKQAIDARLNVITNQPGATDEIMQKMSELAASDDRYMQMYHASDETAIQFFNEAKLAVREETLAKREAEIAAQSATEAKATATRKAGAANRAVARPGGSKAASNPAENFSLKSFRSVDDALANINSDILSTAGVK